MEFTVITARLAARARRQRTVGRQHCDTGLARHALIRVGSFGGMRLDHQPHAGYRGRRRHQGGQDMSASFSFVVTRTISRRHPRRQGPRALQIGRAELGKAGDEHVEPGAASDFQRGFGQSAVLTEVARRVLVEEEGVIVGAGKPGSPRLPRSISSAS